ncbi:MAG: class I SAM-dependent methyltransferase [Bryobacteraceae bacterium]
MVRFKAHTARRVAGEVVDLGRAQGLGAAARRVWDLARATVRWYNPFRATERNEQCEFDRVHGVDTSGHLNPGRLRVSSPNVVYSQYYKGIDPEHFHAMMDAAGVRFAEYSFVDFGSGKGRALMMASEYPFRDVTGVEFAEDLHAIAVENLKRYRGEPACKRVRSTLGDATEFDLPPAPLVLYFYDPFDGEVLERVIANIERSLNENPRDCVILYAHPRFRELFDRQPWLAPTLHADYWIRYQANLDQLRPDAAAAALAAGR